MSEKTKYMFKEWFAWTSKERIEFVIVQTLWAANLALFIGWLV